MSTFNNITDLPSVVRERLSEEAQRVWLGTYNDALALMGSESAAANAAWAKTFPSTAAPISTVSGMQYYSTGGNVPPNTTYVTTVTPSTVQAHEEKAGYWIDLAEERFEDGWIQAVPFGTYSHPLHGKIEITPEVVKAMADGVKTKVRGQDLDIDYDHKERSGEAAGWVKDAQVRQDGLWLKIDFTDSASKAIKEKRYRYFSPEFAKSWKHPKTGAVHQHVLFGGALTNRPFLKDILPINLSEMVSEDKGERMPNKELAKLLGIDEDASDEDVLKAAQSKLTPPKEETEEKKELVSATEVTKLSEHSDPVVRQLAETVSTLETALRLSEIDAKLAKLDHLTPAQISELRDLAIEAPRALSDKLIETFGKAISAPTVELGERGRSNPESVNATATKLLSDKVAELRKSDDKLSYRDAVEIVSMNEPTLYQQYREESFVREVGR